jgi:hypothetical protein
MLKDIGKDNTIGTSQTLPHQLGFLKFVKLQNLKKLITSKLAKEYYLNLLINLNKS